MITEILNESLIERKDYVQHIQKFLNTPLVKVITGQRRVGKSSILKTFIQHLYTTKAIPLENFFYVDKEHPQFANIRTHQDLRQLFETFLKTTKAGKIFVGIDEIQDIQAWEIFIRGVLAEYQENAEIFITGSNGFLLSGDLATYLTGRYIEFPIYPLSFAEFCTFKKVKKSREQFMEYLKYGGLP
jgi:predicted AAA+ superfamily ATPase